MTDTTDNTDNTDSTGIADEFDPRPVTQRIPRFDGLRWAVRTDHVELSSGEVVVRDYIVHPGAVGILALDDDDRVLFIRQYRHPVGFQLWEPPAGLMDMVGESALRTAQRELVEEAGLLADEWHVLADWFNSPGGTSEAFRCFLARGLHEVPGGRPPGSGEEADLPTAWVPLSDAVDLVLAGALANPTSATGVLAAAAAQARGWQGLRPADTPWPTRDQLISQDRVWLPSD
ncbi:MAG: NUDIX hydrolase [Candidatus Nanopelagicales bacterium]